MPKLAPRTFAPTNNPLTRAALKKFDTARHKLEDDDEDGLQKLADKVREVWVKESGHKREVSITFIRSMVE